MTTRTVLAFALLAATAAAGGIEPRLVALVDHADAIVIGRASRDAVDDRCPDAFSGHVQVVVDAVLCEDVAVGDRLGAGSPDVGPAVLAFVIDGKLSRWMRRADSRERRRAFIRAVLELRVLRARDGSRDELKALLLAWVADPHLRDDALVELAAGRAGHTTWLGEDAPRWRITGDDKAALVDVIEAMDGTDGLDMIVRLIGAHGGDRYTRALFERLDAHPDAPGLRDTKRRLATLVASPRAAAFADTRTTREFLDVVRPLVPTGAPSR